MLSDVKNYIHSFDLAFEYDSNKVAVPIVTLPVQTPCPMRLYGTVIASICDMSKMKTNA